MPVNLAVKDSVPIRASSSLERTVAVAGLGAVGNIVAQRLDSGIPGLRLVAVSARNRERAAGIVAGFSRSVPVENLARLPEIADVVVECLPSTAFPSLAEPTLRAGRILVVISVGALLEYPDAIETARKCGAQIIVPSGALVGLDAVQAAAEGSIYSIRMITRKPPAGLAGAPYLRQNGISLDGLSTPLKVFEGTARDAVRGFPANVNVAAALGLAANGLDRTLIEIWADPTIDRNRHTIVVDSDSAKLEMTISNIPTAENPATGKITALSVVAALRKLGSPIRIGT
jgi:aspartate dehydrogenase